MSLAETVAVLRLLQASAERRVRKERWLSLYFPSGGV